MHYEDNDNREVSPTEGENKNAESNETQDVVESDRPSGQVTENKGIDAKDEDEGQIFVKCHVKIFGKFYVVRW